MTIVSVNGKLVAAFKTQQIAIQTVNTTYCNCGGVRWSDDKSQGFNAAKQESIELMEEDRPIDRTVRVLGKQIPYFEEPDHL